MASLANGSDKNVRDLVVKDDPLCIQGHSMHLDFQAMNITWEDVILGRECLF